MDLIVYEIITNEENHEEFGLLILDYACNMLSQVQDLKSKPFVRSTKDQSLCTLCDCPLGNIHFRLEDKILCKHCEIIGRTLPFYVFLQELELTTFISKMLARQKNSASPLVTISEFVQVQGESH